MSSVDPSKTNEAGGLQGTAQNLGASLGTALIGSVLIAALTQRLRRAGRAEPRRFPPPVREQVAEIAERGIPVVPVERRRAGRARRRRSRPTQAEALADDYGDAQLHGLKRRDRRRRACFALLVALVHAEASRAALSASHRSSTSRSVVR